MPPLHVCDYNDCDYAFFAMFDVDYYFNMMMFSLIIILIMIGRGGQATQWLGLMYVMLMLCLSLFEIWKI